MFESGFREVLLPFCAFTVIERQCNLAKAIRNRSKEPTELPKVHFISLEKRVRRVEIKAVNESVCGREHHR